MLPDCVSEAYVFTYGADGIWHVVDRSGPSRLVGREGVARFADDALDAMTASAEERGRYAPGRTFVAAPHADLAAYGYEVR